MSGPGPEPAGSQMERDNGLLCMPDHIQELRHSEATRVVISYWATGLLYAWAKFLICSGKTFYHHTTVEFIHQGKHHHVPLYHDLYSILYPKCSAQLILRRRKGYGWSGKGTRTLQIYGTASDGGMTMTLQAGKKKRQSKRLNRCLRNHDWHGEGGQGLPVVSWSHPVQEAQGIKSG